MSINHLSIAPGHSPSQGTCLQGFRGIISDARIIPAAEHPPRLQAGQDCDRLDLTDLARHAMHYLTNNPRPHLACECIFHIYPLAVSPVPMAKSAAVPGDRATKENGHSRMAIGGWLGCFA